MRETSQKLSVLAGLVILVAVLLVSSLYAATSVIHDPGGDVGGSPPYLDVAHAYVIEQQGSDSLLFMMELTGPIPEEPSETDLIWPFHVNTNPDTNPATFPGGLYNEWIVRVRWVSNAFVGQVVDRRPLLSGGAPVVTSIPFKVDGTTVKARVPRSLLGNPSSFGWNAATRPGAGVPYVDFAPDAQDQFDSSNLATWAQ